MTKKKSKQSKKKTPAQKIEAAHKAMARAVFRGAGFKRHPKLSDKAFTFDGQKSDFDDVYISENIILCIEYTLSTDVGKHLKPKKIVYDKILSDKARFIEEVLKKDDQLKIEIESSYNIDEFELRIVYCSRYDFDDSLKSNVTGPIYFDYPQVRYFKAITDAIRLSARHELLNFLNLPPNKVGIAGVVNTSLSTDSYEGSLLPEANSNFPSGFKVVSFYVDPAAILSRAYVLRKDGWADTNSAYQRMLSKTKIDNIRKYLRSNKRVFVNNIIATLDPTAKILDEDGNTVNPQTITQVKPVNVQISHKMNTVGLIDGQHRVYSYYEDKKEDEEIDKLRKRQNLLMTGIIFPNNYSAMQKEKFEARLFLEINSTQTNAKSDLKQAIGLVLEPFSAQSIATRVLRGMSRTGPLQGKIQQYFFDTDKLKTTSVVSYALRGLVKPSGEDSLFHAWSYPNKELLLDEDEHTLGRYIQYCISEINQFLGAVKDNVDNSRWKTERNVPGRLITTTNINAFIICLRLLVEHNKKASHAAYKVKLNGIDKFNFGDYHSSQYNRMAQSIYKKHFC